MLYVSSNGLCFHKTHPPQPHTLKYKQLEKKNLFTPESENSLQKFAQKRGEKVIEGGNGKK